jgi:hypothetical protein
MMVIARRNDAIRCRAASHQPTRMNHRTFPIADPEVYETEGHRVRILSGALRVWRAMSGIL